MRRALMSRPLLMCLLPLAVAACGGETIPPAPGPAHLSPTVTATATATATPTALPSATPTPSPAATPTPDPTPAATATPISAVTPTPATTPEATPEPISEPHEFTLIKRVERRPLPTGVALYYWVTGSRGRDLRRVLFDGAAGSYREDRPLAFFDDKGGVEHAGVSASGQEVAAMVCHVGRCSWVIEWESPDAVQHLWVSRDAGRTWEDLGQVLPGSLVGAVTEADVVVVEWNLWESREWWNVSDEEWSEMLERLAPLGLDEVEGWESRNRWAVSGEAYTQAEPTRPRLARVFWRRGGTRPDGSVAWTSWKQGDYTSWVHGYHLLVIADKEGAVQERYRGVESLEKWRSATFATNDLLLRPTELGSEMGDRVANAEVIDLAASTLYAIEGLSLPLGFDPETDGQQEVYYQFIAARPAPD